MVNMLVYQDLQDLIQLFAIFFVSGCEKVAYMAACTVYRQNGCTTPSINVWGKIGGGAIIHSFT